MRQQYVVFFVLIMSGAVWCEAAEQGPVLSGQWEGAVQIPGYELRVVIDLARNDQQWVGSLTAPQFGVKGAPLIDIVVRNADVEFGLKAGVKFTAHLEGDGVLKGEYKQGGNSAPFLLKRAGEAHVDLPELSTPISKDIQGEWKGAVQLPNSTVNLILKLPNGGTPTAPGGELVVIDGGNTIPMTLWKQAGSRVFALFGDGGISYDGEFHKEAAEISGSIRNGLVELPLTLHRSTTISSAPASPAGHPETK